MHELVAVTWEVYFKMSLVVLVYWEDEVER